MAGNSLGNIFRITTFGESHGSSIGVIIDGFPANINIDKDFIQFELNRRKPGQSKIVTQRSEDDIFSIESGVFKGKSMGTPIAVVIRNTNQKSSDYSHIENSFRPSHADYTYQMKYGNRDYRGGGRASARETAARVIAGAFAKMALKKYGIEIFGYVDQVGDIKLQENHNSIDRSEIESNIIRCPNPIIAKKMISLVEKTKIDGNTIGGTIVCVIKNVPVGLGNPVFDKLHADLGKATLSINACKGFEIGSGFTGTKMKGSAHNDIFYTKGGKVLTKTNYSGGIQGGISNGMDIYFRAAFKPVATIMKDQDSINSDFQNVIIKGKGRHDPCVVPRAVPIVEAMAAITILDHLLLFEAYNNSKFNQ